jgi:hypothetical protein
MKRMTIGEELLDSVALSEAFGCFVGVQDPPVYGKEEGMCEQQQQRPE